MADDYVLDLCMRRTVRFIYLPLLVYYFCRESDGCYVCVKIMDITCNLCLLVTEKCSHSGVKIDFDRLNFSFGLSIKLVPIGLLL